MNEDLAGDVDQPVTGPERALNAFGFNRYAALAEVFLKRSMVGMLFVFWLTFESAGMMGSNTALQGVHVTGVEQSVAKRTVGGQHQPTGRRRAANMRNLGPLILMRCTQQ